jgi:transmembrane sensor
MKDQIRNILDKGKTENCTSNDEKEMFALFQRPEIESEVKEILTEDLSSEAGVANIEYPEFKTLFSNIWAKIEKKQKRQKNSIRNINNLFKLAAAITVGFFIGTLVTFWGGTTPVPVYYVAYAPKGSVSEIILPDGSAIFLNADSRVKYSIDGKNNVREVFLEGEAWFDVEKNKEKPFLVHTPFYDVNVTGTQFNIKAYEADNTLTTTLEIGQIIIQSTDKYRLAEDIIINPGEQATLNKDSRELTIKRVNTKWVTSWKDNKLIFVNMDLKELVILLERKYGVDIEIKNKEILDLHFDGTIKNESIIEFLNIIQKTLPINYKIIGQKIIITNKS